MKTLASEITAYKEALDALPSEKADNYESSVRAILIARDGVAKKIKNASRVDGKTYDNLVAQDKRLKEAARVVVEIVGKDIFVDWREAHQPPVAAWWWFLDERVAENEARDQEAKRKNAAFWIILTALCVSGSIHLTAEITRRFMGEEGHWSATIKVLLEAPLTVLNAGLGVLALSTLTNPGREWAERLLAALGLFEKYSFKKRFIVAATIFLLVLGFLLSLPSVARFYERRGARFAQQYDSANAVINLQRAIRLDPTNANAHYNLALVYESQNDSLTNNEAINEYRAALSLDNGFAEARNGLMRLYIRNAKGDEDLNHILQNLTNAIQLSPPDWDVQYALYKNRGWVNWRLGHYPEAKCDLQKAIEIDLNRPGRVDALKDRVAPHCLLAEVLKSLHREEEAMEESDICVRYQCSAEEVEQEWVLKAQERTGTVGGCVR
jgi:tetratricopeptide (TPR) repeat protein